MSELISYDPSLPVEEAIVMTAIARMQTGLSRIHRVMIRPELFYGLTRRLDAKIEYDTRVTDGYPDTWVRLMTPCGPVDVHAEVDVPEGCMFVDDSRMPGPRGVPWPNVEAIAMWVEGDGTDSQRIALADGIREGRHQ